MADRANGFYWVYTTADPAGWLPNYWADGAWQYPNIDSSSITSIGPQLQPPNTGSQVRPDGIYWIQLLPGQANSEWQVAYWNGERWMLTIPNGPVSYENYSADDSQVAYIGPMLEQPAG
ncbi:hypothetical protein SAMN05446635_0299 [Burkholderia sp. OK233]|nr:hypothetical protein SAMN05446635_0299 [Burkholderia sp. OK233]